MIEADSDFLQAFENCTLRKTCWNHASHLRMAWLQLERHASYEEALNQIRDSIQRFNAAVGKKGYHETVTVAFTRLIHHRRLLTEPMADWRLFLERNPDLLSSSSPILERHFSKERLMSGEAREKFIDPDVKPLPAAGRLRIATEEDAPGILRIYRPYVETTPISFEIKCPSEDEIRRRVRLYSELAPWLVYIVTGQLAGYAYGSQHRAREAYAWSVDVSAYVAPEFHRQGVGKVLYSTLLRLLTRQGYFNAFAGITLPNRASVEFHEDLGFGALGVYRNVGHKLGSWHDVGWWQRELRAVNESPAPLLKVPTLP